MTKENFDQLEKEGITSFHFLNESDCNLIIKEAATYSLTLAQPTVGKVTQVFFEATIDCNISSLTAGKVLSIQNHISKSLTNFGGEQVFSSPLNFSEVRIQKYLRNGCITMHKDGFEFKNLVVSLLLKGESCFYVADDRLGTNKRLIPAFPGWCIVLAAPGLFGKEHRPFHCVENVQNQRWTLGMRDLAMV